MRLLPLLALLPCVFFGQTVEGVWVGTLGVGDRAVSIAFLIEKTPDGSLGGQVFGVMRNTFNPVTEFSVTGNRVRFKVARIRAAFEGTFDGSTQQMRGTWIQPDVREDAVLARREITSISSPLPREVDVFVSAPPIAVPAGGRIYSLYEVHILNWSSAEIELVRLDLSIDGKLLRIEGPVLKGWSYRYQTKVAPQARGAVLIGFDSNEPPTAITHRLTFRRAGEVDLHIDSLPTTVSRNVVPISPPLKGGTWVAGNGPDVRAHHRTTLVPANGQVLVPQRFAFDFSKATEGEEKISSTEPWNPRKYPSYGAEVLAVRGATVVKTADGRPDNIPHDVFAGGLGASDWMFGNYVVLDLGERRYALYAHLQPGIRVKTGDKVSTGQVLGLLGNSGQSNTPHLHFQITDGPDPLASEGIPFVFGSFRKGGELRRNEMPLQGWTLDFETGGEGGIRTPGRL